MRISSMHTYLGAHEGVTSDHTCYVHAWLLALPPKDFATDLATLDLREHNSYMRQLHAQP